jgi:hypothetical protein
MCTVQQREGSLTRDIDEDDAVSLAGLDLAADWAAGKASGAPIYFDIDDALTELRRKLTKDDAE